MAYRKVYFRIHTEGYVSGWSSDSDKAAFKEESRRLFKSLGWTLTLGHNGCCDTVTKGQGEIILTDIEPGTYLAIERDTGDAGHILDASYQEVVKTIRGLGGIAVTSTQGMQDLFGLDGGKYGKGILDSSRIKLVMQMENRRHGSFKECSICLRMKSDRSPDSAGGRGYSVLGITMSLSNSTPPKKSTTPTLEVPEPHIQKCENGISGSAEMTHPEVPKLHPSQKEKSYTDPIHTETSPSVGQAAGRTDAEPPGETIVLGMSEQEQPAGCEKLHRLHHGGDVQHHLRDPQRRSGRPVPERGQRPTGTELCNIYFSQGLN